MKFVYQKRNDECFRAALASVLDLNLTDLPYVDPKQSRVTWLGMWNVWLAARGLKAVETTQQRHIKSAGLKIGVINSKGLPGHTHAVIINKGVIIHNPAKGADPYLDRRKIKSCFILRKIK